MTIKQISAAALLCIIASVFTAWSIYPVAFYKHHGYSPADLDKVRPALTLAPSAVVHTNYLWLLSYFFPHTDTTIHVSRIFWVIGAAVSFSFLVWRISNCLAASLLSFLLFLHMPTLASSRLWSVSPPFNMSSCAACFCLSLEWQNIRDGTVLRRRCIAVTLYVLSVLSVEYFYSIPILLILMSIALGQREKSSAFKFSSSVLAWYVVPVFILSYFILVSRKHFMEDGLGILSRIASVPYLKSVIGQLTSNFGDRFFMFLIDNMYLYYEKLSIGVLVYLVFFSIVAALLFVVLARGPSDHVRRTLMSVPAMLTGIGLAIIVLSAVSNSVGIYTYSLGYGEDRTNQASAIGAAMALTGLLLKLVSRGGVFRVAGAVCCFAVLLSMTKAAALQAQDWRRVRQWEVQLGKDYRNYVRLRPEVAQDELVVIHGFPRFVSSFDFNPDFIWLAYAYPAFDGMPGAYYRLSADDIERIRHPWKEKIKRHFDRGYRFWPMLIAPIHPTGEHLSAERPVKVIHVDLEFGIHCTSNSIVLPFYQGRKIAPIGVDKILFAEWNESSGATFKKVSVRDCQSIAEGVNGPSDLSADMAPNLRRWR